MLIKTDAIVINTTRYQEKSLIVNCYTSSFGLMSFFVPSAFGSKKNNQSVAFFQPLNILQLEIYYKPNNNLHKIRDINAKQNNHDIHLNIIKSSQAVFVSEIIKTTIKEQEENKSLFNFLQKTIQQLDEQETNPDFHLIFLIKLTRFLGFAPQEKNADNIYFDLETGQFLSHPSFNCINQTASSLMNQLIIQKDFANSLRINYSERKQLIQQVLNYYKFHIDGFKQPKSLEVLEAVFGE